MKNSIKAALGLGISAGIATAGFMSGFGFGTLETLKQTKVNQPQSSAITARTVETAEPQILTPKKVVTTADFKLCTDLDKSGERIAKLLDNVGNDKFIEYKNAVAVSCDWHQSQIDASLSRWQAKNTGSNTAVRETAVTEFTGDLDSNGRIDPWESHQLELRGLKAIDGSKLVDDEWRAEQAALRQSEEIAAEKQAIKDEQAKCPTCRQGFLPDRTRPSDSNRVQINESTGIAEQVHNYD